MNVAFLASDLGKWDLLERDAGAVPEALVLPFFEDERPLRGAAGLVDWRLCGRLSRLIGAGGRVSGAANEVTLYPGGRVVFPRLLLVGLGRSDAFDENTARRAADDIATAVTKLGVQRVALSLPGRSIGRLSARRALEIYLEVADKHDGHPPDLYVVESVAGQKEAADLARRS